MRRPKHQPKSEEETDSIIRSWAFGRSDTEAAILAGSFLEDRLGFAIKSCFVKLPQTGNTTKGVTEASLFQGYGPLASFYAKIDIGYALGLYGLSKRADFHVIRSIRNAFAHSDEVVTFQHEEVRPKCQTLRSYRNSKSAIGIIDVTKTNKPELVDKLIYLSTCSVLIGGLEAVEAFRALHRPVVLPDHHNR